MDANSYDPWAGADNPTPAQTGPQEFFGQALVDVFACVLEKGRGKMPFNPNAHRVEDRRTAVKVDLVPLPEHNVNRPVYREYVAEFGPWPKITLPSLKALNLSTRTLHNAWVRVQLVPEGRTYTNSAGETKESLTFKFVATYPDEAACRAAYMSNESAPAPAAPAPTPVQPPANGNGHTNGSGQATPAGTNGHSNAAPADDPRRANAWKFVDAVVRQNGGDPARVAEALAKMPYVNQFFSAASPEVLNLCIEVQFAAVASPQAK